MKKLLLIAALLSVSLINSQAFSGSGDKKLQIGTNIQNKAIGVNLGYDFGIGQNMSLGFSSSYALNVDRLIAYNPEFLDRFDLKGRFNAHLGSIINVDDNFDVYPGLNVSLKNFGGHLGLRYFFSDGFGVYSEFVVPFSKYDTGFLTPAEKLYNQFNFNIGAAFNL